MGLDMYFYLNKYDSQCRWDEEKKVLHYDDDLKELEDYIYRVDASKVVLTDYEVGYFRKFNALHSYIVKNFANGEDDCRKIYLSTRDIKQILETLKEVNEDNASQVLPNQTGFFFGSQEYDEWYFKDVENAIELFEKVLKVLESDNRGKWDFYYEASW